MSVTEERTATVVGSPSNLVEANQVPELAGASESKSQSLETLRFHSILFEETGPSSVEEPQKAPAFFGDLNLQQIVDSIVANWQDYNLAPFYYLPLNSLDAITYRQEVMQDLEDRVLMEALRLFSRQMRAMRERLEQVKDLHGYKYALERCFFGRGRDLLPRRRASLAKPVHPRPTFARLARVSRLSSAVCRVGFPDRSPAGITEEVSRFSCMLFLSVPGVYDYAGPLADSRWRRCVCGLPLLTTGSASRSRFFAAPYPAH